MGNLYGKGRVVHVEKVIPSAPLPEARINYRFDNRLWKLPRNHDALIAAIRKVAGTEFAVRVTAPPSVTMELARQESTGAVLMHLVNFDVRRAATGIDVSLLPPAGAAVTAVVRNGRIQFRVPSLAVYDLVLIRPH